jgi:purine-binding chemotaxis protein CheW
MERQLVVFELANEHYGVDISAVESIIKMQAITVVPHAPEFVEGVTNLRGKVLPVIDLRKRFYLTATDRSADKKASTRIIVVAIGKTEVGMVVDDVSEVLTISDEAIEPPPPMVMTINSTFITGIAKLGDKLVIMLDLSKVLSVQEESTLQAI